MATTRSMHRARRRAGEAGAIFLGVAMAFLAENWREERQEMGAVNALALALSEDLEATRVDLIAMREFVRVKTDAALEAREHLRSPTPTISIDSLSQLLATSGAINVQAPVLRSYDQLVATGLLHRLSPGARDALADWFSLMQRSQDYYERDLLEHRRTVDWTRSAASFEQMLRDYFPGAGLGEPRFPHDWEELHGDRELNDILVTFAILSIAADRSYERQEIALGRLIELLQVEYQ